MAGTGEEPGVTDGEWILAIRLRQLGDLLATLEPVRAMRAHRDGRRLALVADRKFHSLLKRFDFIDRLIAEPPGDGPGYARYVRALRALRPAAAIDFHGSVRSALLTIASGADVRVGFDVRGRKACYTIVERRVAIRDGRPGPTTAIALGEALARHVGTEPCAAAIPAISVTDDDRAQGRTALARAGVAPQAMADRRVFGLNPGRAYPSKEWSTDRFVALARMLAERGQHVVVMWGPGERDTAAAIVSAVRRDDVTMAPETVLDHVPGLLQNLAALVTIDSGLKHLAVSARVPTLTLFGSTDPREWHMGTSRDAAMWKGLSCSPCRRPVCPFGHTPCMDHGVGDVMDALAGGWL